MRIGDPYDANLTLAVIMFGLLLGLTSCTNLPNYLTQATTAANTAQSDALADQKAALAIATAAADRPAIQCAQQGVAIESVKAVGPLSAAMKADEYLQMAAIDCKAMNTAAVGNALTLSGLLALIGL